MAHAYNEQQRNFVTKTAYQNEYDFLKKELNLEVGVLDSKLTALGNVICANDKGAKLYHHGYQRKIVRPYQMY